MSWLLAALTTPSEEFHPMVITEIDTLLAAMPPRADS